MKAMKLNRNKEYRIFIEKITFYFLKTSVTSEEDPTEKSENPRKHLKAFNASSRIPLSSHTKKIIVSHGGSLRPEIKINKVPRAPDKPDRRQKDHGPEDECEVESTIIVVEVISLGVI